jgi:predicted MarR family transcription regulator
VIHKKWHLVEQESEAPLARFEGALWSVSQAFQRWEGECIKAAGADLNGSESSVLNFIRMHDIPKALSDIARFLNRDDLSNIQYTIRKLQQLDLIQKDNKKTSGRDISYIVTEKGFQLTEKYAQLRKNLLQGSITNLDISVDKLNEATNMMMLMSGIFESNAREVVIYREKQS